MCILKKICKIPAYIKSKCGDYSRWAIARSKTFPFSLYGFYLSLKPPYNYYNKIEFEDLQARKKSDTIFIFGSGASIEDISEEDWDIIKKNNTMSFNYFVVQKFIDIDFHIIREIANDDGRVNIQNFSEYAETINKNKRYDKTVFLIQKGWKAFSSNILLGSNFLKKGSSVLRFKNVPRQEFPPVSKKFKKGLVHGPGSIVECVNFSYLLGFKHIVLVGVDLYDRRYFWFSEKLDTYSISKITDQGGMLTDHLSNLGHRTGNNIVPFFAAWQKEFEAEGVRLYTLNPKSLLSDVLPIYDTTTRPTL